MHTAVQLDMLSYNLPDLLFLQVRRRRDEEDEKGAQSEVMPIGSRGPPHGVKHRVVPYTSQIR